ncbi:MULTISPECIES: hypothetical protein [Rhodopseudomonas]|uniref:Plasmid stability protein n=1 Tax=Rhodopseudomonas palustris TaxID=1076 RepID=A0A0D7EKY7_RHOPL|nr:MULTISPECIES: hypothetical protein [Rhodopseudomonas]KIZ41504.1 hypothetical protein OO17_14845 [Rhodopseudomonas palustris]MDF3809741.1 hypothetical protein [Rhodopseudomonas sp. BAL398]WOK16895.1 hypothetical protein RBJ75_22585 [Rhodopseudomonas sp. BAL398]
MPDLLIRNLSTQLKERIERQARASDTSLSEAAKALIEKGLGPSEPPRQLGTELFNLIPPEYRSDDLVFEIPDLPSDPPDFS